MRIHPSRLLLGILNITVVGNRCNEANPVRSSHLDSQSVVGAETLGRLHLTKLPPVCVNPPPALVNSLVCRHETDTVELTVKPLFSRLVTREFDFPVHSSGKEEEEDAWVGIFM